MKKTLAALVTLMLAVASPASAATNVDEVAHRGYLGWGAPENTHASMRHAAQKGFAGVEFDVRFTSDNRAVLMHDVTLDRTTTCSGRLDTYSLEDLADCDASLGTVKAKVPTYLSTMKYIQSLSGSMVVFVHVKERLSPSLAAGLIKGARELSNEESRVIFLTEEDSDAVVLRSAGWDRKDEGRTHKPRVGSGVVASTDVERIFQMIHTTADWTSVLDGELFDGGVTYGTGGLGYDTAITEARLASLHEVGKQILGTVGYPNTEQELIDAGVDGLFV